MPTLEWIGKEKVINHDKEVPFKMLDAQYTFDETGRRDGAAESYVIYADACALSEEFLSKHHITFKKIPRDIERL